MKLNTKGKELYGIWEQNYIKENDALGGDYASGNIVEGWCIIDNGSYVKTLTDECGLWIFGYDEGAIDHVEECIEMYGASDEFFTDYTGKSFTFAEMKEELLKYYE